MFKADGAKNQADPEGIRIRLRELRCNDYIAILRQLDSPAVRLSNATERLLGCHERPTLRQSKYLTASSIQSSPEVPLRQSFTVSLQISRSSGIVPRHRTDAS